MRRSRLQTPSQHQNDQDQPDTLARPPSPISVIARAAAEPEQQDNDQHDQENANLPSIPDWFDLCPHWQGSGVYDLPNHEMFFPYYYTDPPPVGVRSPAYYP